MRRLWRPPLRGGIHVCGCGHSGTSILTRLIGAHSQVHAIPGETGAAKKESYGRFKAAVDQFWQAAETEAATVWVEKTPKHIRHLAFILSTAPDAKIVMITRDPRDTVASLKKRYGNFRKSLRRWQRDNALVQRWQTHRNTLVVRYEDLVQEPEHYLGNQIMPFLGLSFEPAQLNYHQQHVSWYANNPEPNNLQALDSPGTTAPALTSHEQHRNQQINQPLFKNIGSYGTTLDNREIAITTRSCRSLAAALGYPLES